MAIYLALAILVCFRRSAFIDICIACSFFIFLFKRKLQESNRVNLFLGLVLASSIMDLIWLILFTGRWDNGNSSDD